MICFTSQKGSTLIVDSFTILVIVENARLILERLWKRTYYVKCGALGLALIENSFLPRIVINVSQKFCC